VYHPTQHQEPDFCSLGDTGAERDRGTPYVSNVVVEALQVNLPSYPAASVEVLHHPNPAVGRLKTVVDRTDATLSIHANGMFRSYITRKIVDAMGPDGTLYGSKG
jgi:hypothetical protein